MLFLDHSVFDLELFQFNLILELEQHAAAHSGSQENEMIENAIQCRHYFRIL